MNDVHWILGGMVLGGATAAAVLAWRTRGVR